MTLVNHHAARFVVHRLGGLLNVLRCLPHRSLNACQRNAVGRGYAAGPSTKPRQSSVNGFLAIQLYQVSASHDAAIQLAA